MNCIPLFTSRWIKDLQKYSTLKKQIYSKVEKIIENPYFYSREILKGRSTNKRKINLTGLRSSEVLDKYRIIYILCTECKEKSLKQKGIFFCETCKDIENGIIFLCFGPHDDAYIMK